MHGTKKDTFWRAQITMAMVPDRSSINVENEKYGGKLEAREIKNAAGKIYLDDLNLKYDIALVKLLVPQLMRLDYENWEKEAPEYQWKPVSDYFKGNFDGNGHTIRGMYVQSNRDQTSI